MTKPTTDPTDAELLEFVARFAGWTDREIANWRSYLKIMSEYYELPRKESFSGLAILPKLEKAEAKLENGHMPDYLNSVDAWLSDVWPKVMEIDPRGTFAADWVLKLDRVVDNKKYAPPYALAVNATARQRCLALYRALEGKLPTENVHADP